LLVLEAKGIERLIKAREAFPEPDPFESSGRWRDLGAENLRTWSPARLARVFRGAAVADLPSRDAISQVAVPTLILAWSGDAAHPVSTAEELGGLIANTELHIATKTEDLVSWTDRVGRFLRAL